MRKKVRGKAGNTKKFTERVIEKALVESAGLQTHAAKRLGCTYQTVRNYINNSEHLQQVLKNVQEDMKDKAEGILNKVINQAFEKEEANKEDIELVKWYLKHKGKDRGYVERQEVSGVQGGAIEVSVSYMEPFTDDEIEHMKKEREDFKQAMSKASELQIRKN